MLAYLCRVSVLPSQALMQSMRSGYWTYTEELRSDFTQEKCIQPPKTQEEKPNSQFHLVPESPRREAKSFTEKGALNPVPILEKIMGIVVTSLCFGNMSN